MSREVMQQALSTLEGWAGHGKWIWPDSALETAKRNTEDAIAALRAALAEPEQCAWQPEDDVHMPSTWRSDCGLLWTCTEGSPGDNDMRYCCGCGAKLVEKNGGGA